MTKKISKQQENLTVQKASVVAGMGLLLMAVLASIGNFGVLKRLVIEGDAAGTTNNLSTSLGTFQGGIAALLVVAVLDVVVAIALYKVFSSVSRPLSRLAAGFRIVYAGLFAVAIAQLVIASGAIGGGGASPQAVMGRIESFDSIWSASLLLFGVHLLLLAYLIFKAKFSPAWLAVLVGIAGLGYFIDSVGSMLVSDYSTSVATVTFIGEVVLIFWLLIQGRKINVT